MDTEVQITQVEQQPRTIFSGPRGKAVKIINRIERSDAYLDKLIDTELKSDELSSQDQALLVELVHGVIRWQNKLDWLLNSFTHGNFSKSETYIRNSLRVALYQILFLERLPHYAAVNEAVEFVKRLKGEKAAGLVNAVLRNIIRNLGNLQWPKPEEDLLQYLTVCYSHPRWMIKRWMQHFSTVELEKFLQSNNEVPPLTLRINKLKIQPLTFLGMLEQQNIEYQASTYLDYFIRLKSLRGIAQMDAFRQGFFSIQDESAAFPVLLLAPKPGETIVDMCAAPGGKTTHIGELMMNQGQVIAIDKYEHKLNLIKTSCERLGITNTITIAADSSNFTMSPVDKILVDAPCSGLGTLRKKPDIKWKRELEDIWKLSKVQESILNNAAKIVKPGGVVVYSTCTTEPEENELIIKAFLEQHPNFKLEDASQFVNKSVVTTEGFIVTLPHRHHLDGSFSARLVRTT